MQAEVKVDVGVEAEKQEHYQQVAKTILKQLGGQRFIVMTGAKNLGQDKGNLSFALPAKSGFVKNGITHVKIELTPMDVYKMIFLKVRKGKAGFGIDTVAELDGVYFDQLQDIFTEQTGLDTHL